MRLLSWLLRVILLTIIVNMIIRLFLPRQRAAGPARGGGPGPSPASGPRGTIERAGGALVRDPQCGTYIPQSTAIAVGAGATAVYFCSEACRTAWRRDHP